MPADVTAPKRFGHHGNAFGFLRLVFASLVIAAHVPEVIDGSDRRELLAHALGTLTLGEVAVDGFFIISGLLISASFLNSRSTGDYLVKRVARIYPAFVVASLLCLLVAAPLGGADLRTQPPGFYLTALGHSLTLNPPDNPGAFAGTHYPDLNVPMWTIRYEFRCYLLVILLGVTGLLRRPAVLAAAAAVLIALMPFAADRIDVLPSWLHSPLWLGVPTNTLRLTGMFLAGAAFRAIEHKIETRPAYLAAAALILLGCLTQPRLAQFGMATAGTVLIVGIAAAGRGTVLERINNTNDVSYGVYLYGWPIEKLLIGYGLVSPLWLLGLLNWIADIGAGWLSWLAIERPAMRLIRSWSRRPAPGRAESTDQSVERRSPS